MPKKPTRRGPEFGTRAIVNPTAFDVGKAYPEATATPKKRPRGMPVLGRANLPPRNETVPKGPMEMGKGKLKIGRPKKPRWL